MRSQEELVSALVRKGVLQTPSIIDAFRSVDRADFVLPQYREEAYEDYPLPIGYEQTISQPSTVAFMLELLQPQQGERVLDIGTGAGWTTALLEKIIGKNGFVTGKEIVPELVSFGQQNLEQSGAKYAKISTAEKGALGVPEKKFDRILVSAAASEVPEELFAQLKTDGVLVCPVRHSIVHIKKISDELMKEEWHEGFSFVPLQ